MMELVPGSQFAMEAKGLGLMVQRGVFAGPPPPGYFQRPQAHGHARLGWAFVTYFASVRSW